VRDSILRALVGMPEADAGTMLEAFFVALTDSGVPSRRAMVALRTLHPQIAGMGYVWERGRKLSCNEHPHGEFALPRFLNSPLREIFEGRGPLRQRLEGDQPLPFPVLHELRARGLTDYLALPLPFTDGQRHAFTTATDRAGGFDDADVALLEQLAPMLAVALETREIRRVARMLLDTYVGERAGRKILDGRISRGEVELIDAVIMSCDLRGFTALSVDAGPEATVATLNAYFDCVCAPIAESGGEILKFIGDGLLAAFPIDNPALLEPTCQIALAAARRAVVGVEQIRDVKLPAHHLPLKAGAALHVGQVAFGNIGSRARLDFTVIGPAVNLASRLAGMCSRLGHDILVSSAFARLVPEGARSLGTHRLRGLPQPEEILTY
jgi:adenylate cyclase